MISGSDLLGAAYGLAAEAHGDQCRATDQAPFLDHVVEVGRLLHEAGFDDEIVAAGLLHDAVERGTLSEARLRAEVDEEISALVLALTEDAAIDSFAKRKEALRDQVRAAGSRAIRSSAATSSRTSVACAAASTGNPARSRRAWERRSAGWPATTPRASR